MASRAAAAEDQSSTRSGSGSSRGPGIGSSPMRSAAGHGDVPPRRSVQGSGGAESNNGSNRSPLLQPRGRGGSRMGSASPGFFERAVGTPVRRQQVRSDQREPERVSVPKFGQWDVTDPSSADEFSAIFEKAVDEKRGGGGAAAGGSLHPVPPPTKRQASKQRSTRKWFCCFQPTAAEG